MAPSHSPQPTLADWLSAARLRTLPLAFAVILLGTGLAAFESPDSFSPGVLALALFTAFAYQVLSNFANDLGDGRRGTDAQKKGEQRAVASGRISIPQMARATVLFTVLALVSGTVLSVVAFQGRWPYQLTFTLIGALATWAARSYTLGGNPYAYWGGGDLFVFVFFGLVGVVGSAALYTRPQAYFLLPAAVAGAMSAAVLTLNNLRDEETDAAAGKRTLVVRYGTRWGRRYFKTLLGVSNVLNLLFVFAVYWKDSVEGTAKLDAGALLGPVGVHFGLILALRWMSKKFTSATTPEPLDALLKPMALITLAYCVATAISLQLN